MNETVIAPAVDDAVDRRASCSLKRATECIPYDRKGWRPFHDL